MRSTCWITIALLIGSVFGCATPQVTPQAERENMVWATTADSQFAALVQDFVTHSFAPVADKAAILARAAVLASHAQQQAKLIEAFRPDGSKDSRATWVDLQARAEALGGERRTLEQEWAVWQVQHGLKNPDDTDLAYIHRTPDC